MTVFNCIWFQKILSTVYHQGIKFLLSQITQEHPIFAWVLREWGRGLRAIDSWGLDNLIKPFCVKEKRISQATRLAAGFTLVIVC